MTPDQISGAILDAQKALQAGNSALCQQKIDAVLSDVPGHPEALYILAVLKRLHKNYPAAQQAIDTLLSTSPDFGRAFQELGHLLRETGDAPGAVAAYQQAVIANPALIASWQALHQLYTQLGQAPQGAQAQQQLVRMKALPKLLLAVTNYLYEGKIGKAEDYCRTYLIENPTDTEGMRLLAEIANRYGVLDEAEFLLESALEFAPENVQIRIDYIQILRKRQNFVAAVEQAKILLDSDPDNPVFMSHLAIQSMQASDYDGALDLFDKILDTLSGDVATHTSRGHALKTMGQQDAAIDAYRTALEHGPTHGDAWYSLANLKTFRFSDSDIGAMQECLSNRTMHANSRVQLHFALGKALEDREDYQQSFEHYQAGNALKAAQSRYAADKMDEEFQAQKRAFTKSVADAKSEIGHPAPDPIFIVGLPRAGSTLLEQILASHSQVDGTMELPNILSLATSLRKRKPIDAADGYPGGLAALSTEDCQRYGEQYISETMQHRDGAPFFTDKMPNNFRHIGLIKSILPNAKIIDARRGAMDCCFSGFKQLFAEGQEFTYGLEQVGQYYRGYVDLMDHWDTVFPGDILRVQYEDVVADLESEVRRILAYCDLPYEAACVDFHKTERAVKTASSEQVRQKINRQGMDKWKPFEPWLGPLKDALGDLA